MYEPSAAPGVLLELARRFTPRLEAVSDALVVLDVAGLGRVWPHPQALGEALVAAGRERGLSCHVALSFSATAARLLAACVPGVTLVALGAEAAALAPLPLEQLVLPPDRLELLKRWGLRTLGDLAALPARGLSERLGSEGPRLRHLARGEDDRPLVPALPPEDFALNLDLDWPVDGLEPLAFVLLRLLEPLCAHLHARGRAAAALSLELRLVDGGRHVRRLAPAAPSVDARTWRTLLRLDLEAHPPRDAIQALEIRAEPTLARRVQFSLLDPAQPAPEKLAETLGRLADFTRAGRGGSPRLLDTHRPGAFAMGSFDPAAPRRRGTEGCRPHVALRLYRPPLRAEVVLRHGTPAFVSAAGVRGAVGDCAGPWRASGDWWDEAWNREEWDIELPTGVFRLYRDRLAGGWFVEGELD